MVMVVFGGLLGFFSLLPFPFLPPIPKTSLLPLSHLCRYEGGERNPCPADNVFSKESSVLGYSLILQSVTVHDVPDLS